MPIYFVGFFPFEALDFGLRELLVIPTKPATLGIVKIKNQ